ncbi:MAG TPA: VacJ family lipoprotein [Candidatus Dormibacteraeota bacterium]|nr:VacJ family lipoprotein [Candidatus Dormibacteraeota bacterium]
MPTCVNPRRLAVALALAALAGAPRPVRAEQAASPTPELEIVPLDENALALEQQGAPSGFPDPWENTNRKSLWVDQQLDRWFVDPVVRTYQFIVPPPGRRAVRRFTLNLDSVAILVNDLLQREWGDACVTTERFAINSTVGIGGLFDPAAAIGMELHHADFGQTLALFGVGSGPYLVLPLFGPSNARDSSGMVVDFFLQPLLYVLPFAELFLYEGSLGFSTGLAARDAYSEGIAALRSSSVDYYSALRNAYYQTRTAEIWDRRDAHRAIAGEPPTAVQ